jgi:hypothetical protein
MSRDWSAEDEAELPPQFRVTAGKGKRRARSRRAIGRRSPCRCAPRSASTYRCQHHGRRSRQDAALRGEIRPTTRPDTDNYVKSALDAINAIVVVDDSLVVELVATKQYARIAKLSIAITPLAAFTAQGRAAA